MATVLTAQQLAFLKSIDSPTIANAIEPYKIRDRVDGFIGGAVKCLFPDMGSMVGHAVTVTMTSEPGPVAGRDGFWKMFDAIEAAPDPVVVVIQDVGGRPTRCAWYGEVMATLTKRLGGVGVVTDGALRDVHEVRELGLHYFAKYDAVVSHGNFEIVHVNQPVYLDGQRVLPGDILHGDANGIVIVPPETLATLEAEVGKIRERERATMDYIKSDAFTLAEYKKRSGY